MIRSMPRGRLMAIGAAVAALLAAGLWAALTFAGGDGSPAAKPAADAKPLPQLLAEEHPTAPAPVANPAPSPAPKPKKGGPIPPASAGSNGSFTPRPASERKQIAARTHSGYGSSSELGQAILLGGTAIAPGNAPPQISSIISAANLLVGKPYKWGGGHAGWRDNGYDCSGAVSFALAGAGLVGAPAASGQFQGWGVPGPGQWLTIFASPSHVYMVVAGLRFDTVGDAKGSGPRWHPFDAYPSGFSVRHLPGL
jgi:cell wall-associated NlpC family hydrolase